MSKQSFTQRLRELRKYTSFKIDTNIKLVYKNNVYCGSLTPLTHKQNRYQILYTHYNDVILSAMASQITSFTIVYSTVYSGADQRKHQSSASLAPVRGIHRCPLNSPHKWPAARKMLNADLIKGFRATQIPEYDVWRLLVDLYNYPHHSI